MGGISCKETTVKLTFGGLVERTADFVEQQDLRWAQETSGDGDALRLTLAQTTASLTQFGIDAIGQVVHKLGCSTCCSSSSVASGFANCRL